MKEVCGTCKHNRRQRDGHCNAEFCCNNEDSEYCGVPTEYSDTCEEWEEKE